MGNYIRRYIVAPSVTREDVAELACSLRKGQKKTAVFTLCDLEGKRVRKSHARLAKELNVRIVEIDSGISSKLLIEAAENVLGQNTFLYREKDDEDLSICHPDALWLKNTFNSDGLSWLLDNFFDDDPPWKRENFYVLPGNPPETDCMLPIHANLLKPVKPGKLRACPVCDTLYMSKFPLAQCTNPECRFATRPFETAREAYRIVKTQVSDDGWGRCPRCQMGKTFAFRIEQCFDCGQLMKGYNDMIKVDLKDNQEQVSDFLNRVRRAQGNYWWKFW